MFYICKMKEVVEILLLELVDFDFGDTTECVFKFDSTGERLSL